MQKGQNIHFKPGWKFSVFNLRRKERVSRKKFTPGWILPRLRVTCILDFCVFGISTNVEICNVIIDIAAHLDWVFKALRDHLFSTFTNFSGKQAFLTSWYTHIRVRIRGWEILVFRKVFADILNEWVLHFALNISKKYEHRKIFEVCLSIFWYYMYERIDVTLQLLNPLMPVGNKKVTHA